VSVFVDFGSSTLKVTMNDSGRGHYTGSTALLSNRTNLHGQFEKFMRACRSGQISIMNEIYEDDKRILQSRAAFGSTAIHIAAENG
jgi:ankyrin repeat protein